MRIQGDNVNVKSVCGACGEVAVEPVAEKGMAPLPGAIPGQWMEPDGAGYIKKRRAAKKRRMRTLGAWDATIPKGKSDEDIEVEGFVCASEKSLKTDDVCANCPGGCKSEKGLPELVEVEGLAEELFNGAEITGSLYNAKNDLFVVQLKVGDDYVESLWGGQKADFMGWMFVKSEEETDERVDENEVSEDEIGSIALKAVKSESGTVNDVTAGSFNDDNAWVVSVLREDGADFDVYVSLDGKVLGWDEYEVKSDEDEDDATSDGVEGKSDEEDDEKKPSLEEEAVNPEEELEDDEEEKKRCLPKKKDDEPEDDDFKASIEEFLNLIKE